MKKILFSCLSLTLVMMLWAFTQPKAKSERKHSTTATWYYYNGGGFPDQQSNYSTTNPHGNCDGDGSPCGIFAEPDAMDASKPAQADVYAAEAASFGFTQDVDDFVDTRD